MFLRLGQLELFVVVQQARVQRGQIDVTPLCTSTLLLYYSTRLVGSSYCSTLLYYSTSSSSSSTR